MHSQPVSGDAGRRRAERKFKSIQKAKAQASQADHPFRQTEAEKTARLRALRLAKEATDRDTANHDAAAATASRTGRCPRLPRPPAASVGSNLIVGRTGSQRPCAHS
jgi:hypothetical protein